MVINDFHIIDVAIIPDKADSILIVDANAMLALPVAFQRLKPISWQCGQKLKCRRCVKHFEFPPRRSLNRLKTPDTLTKKQPFAIS